MAAKKKATKKKSTKTRTSNVVPIRQGTPSDSTVVDTPAEPSTGAAGTQERRRTFTKQMKVPIDGEERLKKHEEHTEVENEIDRVSGEKAKAVAGYNGDLKDLRKHRAAIMLALKTGEETRGVEVYELIDDQLGEVRTYLVDGDVLLPEFTRAMTESERQLGLFDSPPDTGEVDVGEETDTEDPDEDDE